MSDSEMNKENELLSDIEKDTIGEVLNISMGAAATALSKLLEKQVTITTPTVKAVKTTEFEFKQLEPAEGIEIEYIEGLSGSNFLIMKNRDIRIIVNLLIGESGDVDSEDELDEMHLSALGEIMNQMMGSASTSLADFFGRTINISPPKRLDIKTVPEKINRPEYNGVIVSVSFLFKVEGLIDSEFVTVLPLDFAKSLIKKAMSMGEVEEEKPAEKAETKADENKGNTVIKQEENTKPAETVQNEKVVVKPVQMQNFDDEIDSKYNMANFDLIMDVPLDVTVEIGRTKMLIKEILDISQGNILELDKQANDPVDIIVNGNLIARGDVVAIDDYFGVRITEIVSRKEKNEIAKRVN